MPTEAKAKLMYCPMQRHSSLNEDLSGSCKGSGCMAWQWISNAHLETVTRPIDVGLPESFELPSGEGWKFVSTFFDADNAQWFANWARDTDPNQRGVCGMIPSNAGVEVSRSCLLAKKRS